MELNKAHGGTFSASAAYDQPILARFLLKDLNINLSKSNFEAQILTGLDALGRASDLEKLVTLLNTLAGLNTIPEDVRMWLNIENIVKLACAGADLPSSEVLELAKNVQAKLKAQQDAVAQQNLTKQLSQKASPEQLASAAAQG